MKMKIFLFTIIILLIIFVLRLPVVQHVLQNDVTFFTSLAEQYGYDVLWITLPLAVLQSILTLFPFITLIIIHVLVFGVAEGLFFSWLGSSLGAIACFILGRYFMQEWAHKIWSSKKERYAKWYTYVNRYGLWGVVILRSIPIMPSNIISVAASLSPMTFTTYVWSTVIGNISMVWSLGLMSFGLIMPDVKLTLLISAYALFVIVISALAFIHLKITRLS